MLLIHAVELLFCLVFPWWLAQQMLEPAVGTMLDCLSRRLKGVKIITIITIIIIIIF
jgi:hypothetical protein